MTIFKTIAVSNTMIKMAVLASFALIIDRNARLTNKLNSEVQLLEGLLPVCSFYKKIRDDKNQWQPIEKYIMARSPVSFSHGVCPNCVKKYYGDVLGENK